MTAQAVNDLVRKLESIKAMAVGGATLPERQVAQGRFLILAAQLVPNGKAAVARAQPFAVEILRVLSPAEAPLFQRRLMDISPALIQPSRSMPSIGELVGRRMAGRQPQRSPAGSQPSHPYKLDVWVFEQASGTVAKIVERCPSEMRAGVLEGKFIVDSDQQVELRVRYQSAIRLATVAEIGAEEARRSLAAVAKEQARKALVEQHDRASARAVQMREIRGSFELLAAARRKRKTITRWVYRAWDGTNAYVFQIKNGDLDTWDNYTVKASATRTYNAIVAGGYKSCDPAEARFDNRCLFFIDLLKPKPKPKSKRKAKLKPAE